MTELIIGILSLLVLVGVGYVIKVRVDMKKTVRDSRNRVDQSGNIVGGNMAGRDQKSEHTKTK